MKTATSFIKNKTVQLIIIWLLFTIVLCAGYIDSAKSFNGDSYEYFGLIKDIFYDHRHYFEWSAAGGYNLFSTIYIFSYLIGIFTYHSPIIFFLIINSVEILLLLLSVYVFMYLTNAPTIYKEHFSILAPVCMSVYIILYHYSNGDWNWMFYTDLYIIFNDSIIIMMLGFIINIAMTFITENSSKYNIIKKITILIVVSYYMSATTLRYTSTGIGLQLLLLLFMLRPRLFASKANHESKKLFGKSNKRDSTLRGNKTSKKLKTTLNNSYTLIPNISLQNFCILATILLAIFAAGYFSFFLLESYSISSRHIYQGRFMSYSTIVDKAYSIIGSFFSSLTNTNFNFIALGLRWSYLLLLILGFISALAKFIPILNKINLLKKNILADFFIMFAFLTCIFIIVTSILSKGVTFLYGDGLHYFELSVIFAFIGLYFILSNLPLIRKYSFQIAFIGILITSIITSINLYYNHKIKIQNSNLAQCINKYQAQYNLNSGIADYWVARTIMASDFNTNILTFATMSSNLDFNWLNNVYQPVGLVNFAVYTNSDYKNKVLTQLNNYLPNFSANSYIDIPCEDNNGLLVLNNQTSQLLSTILLQLSDNSRSWFAISSYSIGQDIWKKLPWNQKFLTKYNTYNFYGSVLRPYNNNFMYSINPDLSIDITGNGSGILLVSDFISMGSGNYQITINYNTSDSFYTAVLNTNTSTPITQTLANNNTNSITTSFKIDKITPVILAIAISGAANNTKIRINKLSLKKL